MVASDIASLGDILAPSLSPPSLRKSNRHSDLFALLLLLTSVAVNLILPFRRLGMEGMVNVMDVAPTVTQTLISVAAGVNLRCSWMRETSALDSFFS